MRSTTSWPVPRPPAGEQPAGRVRDLRHRVDLDEPAQPPGRVELGTKTLLPNVSGNITSAPRPCTDRGSPTTIASAVNTQHIAKANTITRPNAARRPARRS